MLSLFTLLSPFKPISLFLLNFFFYEHLENPGFGEQTSLVFLAADNLKYIEASKNK